MIEKTAGQRLTFDFDLDAPPEKVWRALTVPAFVDRWLTPDEPAGSRSAKTVVAEVIEADAPRRLSWNWREAGEPEGIVTFTLTSNETGGTSLRLVHVRSVPAMRPAANSNAITMMLAA